MMNMTSHITKENNSKLIKTEFSISGMTCASCVNTVEKSLMKKGKASSASVNLIGEKAYIEYDPSITSPEEMIAAVEKVGYGAAELKESEKSESYDKISSEQLLYKHNLTMAILFSIPIFFLSMMHMFLMEFGSFLPLDFITSPYNSFMNTLDSYSVFHVSFVGIRLFILTTPVQFWLGWNFHRGAYKAIMAKYGNMDVLVSLGTNAAYFYSIFALLSPIFLPNIKLEVFFETSGFLITFFLLGKFLDYRA